MRTVKKTATCKSGNKSEKNGADMNCASNNLERIPEELEILADAQCEMFKADEDAVRVLGNSISGWVDVDTYLYIIDLMRGMEPKLAMKVAHYIGDFCCGLGRQLTDIEHLDLHLLTVYKRIYDQAKATGNKLEMPCLF